MPVSKRTRYEVLKRDNHTCRYCGGTAPDVKLTVDHVTPIALGGSDSPENLVAACADCNAGKSSTTPNSDVVADVKAIDLKWSNAMAEAARALEAEHDKEQEYLARWLAAWTQHTWGRYPSDGERSVLNLYRAGLPIEQVESAAEIAGSAYGVQNRFSYFMGICWKRVTAMQEIAKQLLEADEASR